MEKKKNYVLCFCIHKAAFSRKVMVLCPVGKYHLSLPRSRAAAIPVDAAYHHHVSGSTEESSRTSRFLFRARFCGAGRKGSCAYVERGDVPTTCL